MTAARVLIVGGGTGGHISPGIALYEAFRGRGVRACFLTGANDGRFLSDGDIAGEDLFFYGAPGFTKNIFKLPAFGMRFVLSVIRAARLIKREGIDAVIGMGGYVSAPALAAAVLKKTPLYLCEQNTVPGKVTTLFARKARKIFTTFEETRDYLAGDLHERLLPLGNPIRGKVFRDMDRESAKKVFNLKHCRRVVLAIGGSQGAVSINELIHGLRTRFADDLSGVGIIWSTGEYSYKKYREAAKNDSDFGSVYLSPYIDDVGVAYRAADIAISRSGSGVMMELAAMGVPSILIPYPHAAMNHQEKNADVFDKAGASVKIANNDAVPEKVAPVLGELLSNQTVLERMARKARAAGKPMAGADIAGTVIGDIVNDGKERAGV